MIGPECHLRRPRTTPIVHAVATLTPDKKLPRFPRPTTSTSHIVLAMVNATIHAALTQMFFDDPETRPPWNFPDWQAITGVRHGLFPDEDALLPPGWTREQANFIFSYFDQFDKKPTEEAKMGFSSARKNANQVPGRQFWRDFVTKSWKVWGIHAKISAVLSSENLHPLTIALGSKHGSVEKIPRSADYIYGAVDPVARALFGIESLDKHGRLEMDLRRSLHALIYRTWLNLKNQVLRSKDRLAGFEKDATEAFEALDKEQPTKADVKAVIVKVARWRNLAETLQVKEYSGQVGELDAQLQALMLQLSPGLPMVAPLPEPVTSRAWAATVQSLASEKDISDVTNLYIELFNNPAALDSVPLQDQQPTIGISLDEVERGDLGVQVEALMSPEALCASLGFRNGLPVVFNAYRHKGGLSSWDPANADLFEPTVASMNPDMDRLKLHWHQAAGVHAILRMNFTAGPDTTRPNGVLVADEVGLGKTFQAATLVAFLSELTVRHKMKAVLPPVIASTPYLGGLSTLPPYPHLIVVPGTLLSQWESEMKVLFKCGSFDIFVYGTGKGARESFWASDGPFRSSKHDTHRIIIASHSALQQDFSSIYLWTKPPAPELPWGPPTQLPTYSSTVERTLYGQTYLSVTIDEAHAFRNVGAKHLSVLMLMKKSLMRLVMTATPLQTSTKDIAGMGRLLGVPYFLSQDAYEAEKNDLSTIRQAKRNSSEEVADEAVRNCQVAVAQRLQTYFVDRILRRGTSSLDWRGAPLVSLPPCREIFLQVKPTPREMEIISELADRVKENVSTSNSVLMIVSRSFYIEHRMAVGYARYDLDEKIPHFDSLSQWSEKKSTKMDTCARLCQHLLTRDDVPEVAVVDGALVLPPFPELPEGQDPQRTLKILISQEFPSLAPLLRNVLDLYKIGHLSIDGQMSYSRRAKTVKKFTTDPNQRVLIMSSVGAVGLNLTVASVIIFLDQPWSAQDELQIRGRAHRQPQKQTVRCYHILADETADIVLASLASGKRDMMTGFLRQDRGKEMLDLLTGHMVPDEKDDQDDAEVTAKPKKAAKPRPKAKGKAQKNVKGVEQVAGADGSSNVPEKEATAGASSEQAGASLKQAETQVAKGQVVAQTQRDVEVEEEQQVGLDLEKEKQAGSGIEKEKRIEPDVEMEDKRTRNDTDDGEVRTSTPDLPSQPEDGRNVAESSDEEMASPGPSAAEANPFDLPSTPPRPSDLFGGRRPRFLSPTSPDVRPVAKRQRIVDYQSSPPMDALADQDDPNPSPTPTHLAGMAHALLPPVEIHQQQQIASPHIVPRLPRPSRQPPSNPPGIVPASQLTARPHNPPPRLSASQPTSRPPPDSPPPRLSASQPTCRPPSNSPPPTVSASQPASRPPPNSPPPRLSASQPTSRPQGEKVKGGFKHSSQPPPFGLSSNAATASAGVSLPVTQKLPNRLSAPPAKPAHRQPTRFGHHDNHVELSPPGPAISGKNPFGRRKNKG